MPHNKHFTSIMFFIIVEKQNLRIDEWMKIDDYDSLQLTAHDLTFSVT